MSSSDSVSLRPISATARIINEEGSVCTFIFSVKVDIHATHSISSKKELFKDLTPVNTIQGGSSPSTSGNTIAGIGTLVFHIRRGTGYGQMHKIELPGSLYVPSYEGRTLLCPSHWAQMTQTQTTWALFDYYKSDNVSNEPREESKEGGSPPPREWLKRFNKIHSTNHQFSYE